MYTTMIVVFVIGYLAIALEHFIKIDKTASALLIGTVCWIALILGRAELLPHIAEASALHFINENLMHHIGEIAGILFFLLGAMTIVELIDAHEGFSVITEKIKTTKRVSLLWILAVITFFLSAALDNLTTSIVMVALIRKLIARKTDQWMFAGIVILSANAGGAWSPIGDVTTIMLWIGGQVSTYSIIKQAIIPSIVCLVVPLIGLSFKMKGEIERPVANYASYVEQEKVTVFEKNLVFILGISSLLAVPVLKTMTHLPPFMGILLGLGVLWIVTELLHYNKNHEEKAPLSVIGVLKKVDVPSVLFFLGILTAVAGLQTAGHLQSMSGFLNEHLGNIYVLNTALGVLSSVVDNVPIVAGIMGTYSLDYYPTDHAFWNLLAYCAGTGGSILIIGSAAGVAVMGLLKVDFIWYLKNITMWALLGYIAGVFAFFLMSFM